MLLAPLRLPQRVAADIEAMASAVLSLHDEARGRITSIDETAHALLDAVAGLRESVDRIDREVTELQRIEEAVTVRIDALHEDLNTRMRAVEEQVHRMQSPMSQMSRDLATAVRLLPDPGDGPFSRLKDSLTSS